MYELRGDTSHPLYWGYIGIMEDKMETTIMENQMEKKMEIEMEPRLHKFLQAALCSQNMRPEVQGAFKCLIPALYLCLRVVKEESTGTLWVLPPPCNSLY